MNKLPLIEKVYLLESKLGERWVHPILEPFAFNSYDIVEVQSAAAKIAQHLGLPPLTYTVTYTNQNSGVAGHIKLDYSKNVRIEIDYKFKDDWKFVLGILAHEICHKYFQLNNIELFPVYENEILTDIATVYTGLGKISLNGCYKRSQSTYYNFDASSNSVTPSTMRNLKKLKLK